MWFNSNKIILQNYVFLSDWQKNVTFVKILVMKLNAKTMKGFEGLLEKELKKLGAVNTEQGNRIVSFEGERDLLYKVNFRSRLALSVLKPLVDIKIETQEDLYEAVSALPWEKIFNVDKKMAIESFCMNSVFTHTQFLSQRTKDAICDRFRNKMAKRPYIDLENPDIKIDVYLYDNRLVLSLNSSGEPLFKRGYRQDTNKAPINEVLAAGMLALSGWDASVDFFDPMCGSGTILIEACMRACNMPAQYYRNDFSFQHWYDFDRILWRNVKEEANEAIADPECEIFGYDISPRSIAIAEENIRMARLHKDISIRMGDFMQLPAPSEKGVIVCNPPYGERLNEQNINDLYHGFGDKLKKDYNGWTAWLISSNEEALKNIGLHCSKKYTLFNGPLECKFERFDMYEGSKKGN
ncbi:RNA methyltransferase [Bacteroidia bacterium]|nr:RNA methyltransferase [Bacteroidia bacterium]